MTYAWPVCQNYFTITHHQHERAARVIVAVSKLTILKLYAYLHSRNLNNKIQSLPPSSHQTSTHTVIKINFKVINYSLHMQKLHYEILCTTK